jgi:hypothetical protein
MKGEINIEELYGVAHELKAVSKYCAENSNYYTAKELLKFSEVIEINLKMLSRVLANHLEEDEQ